MFKSPCRKNINSNNNADNQQSGLFCDSFSQSNNNKQQVQQKVTHTHTQRDKHIHKNRFNHHAPHWSMTNNLKLIRWGRERERWRSSNRRGGEGRVELKAKWKKKPTATPNNTNIECQIEKQKWFLTLHKVQNADSSVCAFFGIVNVTWNLWAYVSNCVCRIYF